MSKPFHKVPPPRRTPYIDRGTLTIAKHKPEPGSGEPDFIGIINANGQLFDVAGVATGEGDYRCLNLKLSSRRSLITGQREYDSQQAMRESIKRAKGKIR